MYYTNIIHFIVFTLITEHISNQSCRNSSYYYFTHYSTTTNFFKEECLYYYLYRCSYCPHKFITTPTPPALNSSQQLSYDFLNNLLFRITQLPALLPALLTALLTALRFKTQAMLLDSEPMDVTRMMSQWM